LWGAAQGKWRNGKEFFKTAYPGGCAEDKGERPMWTAALDRMLTASIKTGTLDLTFPDGTERRYGDGTGENVTVRLSDTDLPRRLILNPDLAVGEAYTDGTLTIENDDVHGLLALAMRNDARANGLAIQRALNVMRHLARRWRQFNPATRARRNVAHHYDLSGELYDLFLDRDRQYSCAYFTDPGMSLDDAQEAKKRHIARKLRIEPGMRVLDIGCGWGGMGLTLARDFGARVVGVTLSEEQHRIARARAGEAGLSDRVDFRLMDYRDVTETFDRIVSVGMFEHVGVPHYREYFGNVRERLDPSGIALIHTIGRMEPPGITSPWIDRYIFPGGYCPSLSEMASAIENEALYLTDLEVWRLHYAETLRHWHDRFMANVDRARDLYDERFCRMWRFYLVSSEQAFRHNRQCVFQAQLAHDQAAVPLTRDYLYSEDRDELRHAAE
jgi:cyclopropane-fatty-acyl-phospholipid synthase